MKKLRQSSFFVIYSYFKDSAFTAVKRVNAKFLTRYVKEVSFVNRRYSNGLPFLSKMVYGPDKISCIADSFVVNKQFVSPETE